MIIIIFAIQDNGKIDHIFKSLYKYTVITRIS